MYDCGLEPVKIGVVGSAVRHVIPEGHAPLRLRPAPLRSSMAGCVQESFSDPQSIIRQFLSKGN
jgi:hypothetical protein